jgi:hypothetical protein
MKRIAVIGAIGLGVLAAAYLLFSFLGGRPTVGDDEFASPANKPVNADEVGGTAQGPSTEKPHYFATGPDTRG